MRKYGPVMSAEFLVICGLSGAGGSRAASDLEDLGWFVIDNVPAALIPKVGELAAAPGSTFERVALVVRIGAAGLGEIREAIGQPPRHRPRPAHPLSSTRPPTS